ncbi:carbohydrate ABC transporter permease [Pseudoruegeria sp. HB172150]|uniref:carbohydrate ABC transporter permease n=1 Tax=Pseudoruegeria sp. HB172150 TaxID=2721164 RepID=UPI001557CFA6|nr:carbohydrate ABC transporter permease [Pseudoruegeria sp. HB172150]
MSVTTDTHPVAASRMSGLTRKQVTRGLRYVALTLLAIVYMMPLLVVLNASLKTPADIQQVLALPTQIEWANYVAGWDRIGRSLWNSVLITGPSVVLSILIGAMAAYPLSQVRFKGDRIVFLFLLAGMLVPQQVVQIPLFMMMRALGLYNTIPGLWLVHLAFGIPFCTFFLRNFFTTIPSSMFEAAQIDGCTAFSYFWKILMPASISGIAALAIIQSRSVWNDLFFGLTLTNSPNTQPTPVALYTLIGGMEVDEGPLMAATVISIIPVMAVFLVFQKAFTRGLLGGSSK